MEISFYVNNSDKSIMYRNVPEDYLGQVTKYTLLPEEYIEFYHRTEIGPCLCCDYEEIIEICKITQEEYNLRQENYNKYENKVNELEKNEEKINLYNKLFDIYKQYRPDTPYIGEYDIHENNKFILNDKETWNSLVGEYLKLQKKHNDIINKLKLEIKEKCPHIYGIIINIEEKYVMLDKLEYYSYSKLLDGNILREFNKKDFRIMAK